VSYSFWAEFVEIGKDIFRFDTRVYLNRIRSIESRDPCIGAVVGKNPGSAKSVAVGKGIQPIKLKQNAGSYPFLNYNYLITRIINIILNIY